MLDKLERLEKLSKNGWTYNKWMLSFEIKKWGFINDFIIRGRKNGWLYRYGVIGFKDSEWVTLLDEKGDNIPISMYSKLFDKIKNLYL